MKLNNFEMKIKSKYWFLQFKEILYLKIGDFKIGDLLHPYQIDTVLQI